MCGCSGCLLLIFSHSQLGYRLGLLPSLLRQDFDRNRLLKALIFFLIPAPWYPNFQSSSVTTLLYIEMFAVRVSCRQRTGGHMSSVMVNISDSTILKVQYELSSSCESSDFTFLHDHCFDRLGVIDRFCSSLLRHRNQRGRSLPWLL